MPLRVYTFGYACLCVFVLHCMCVLAMLEHFQPEDTLAQETAPKPEHEDGKVQMIFASLRDTEVQMVMVNLAHWQENPKRPLGN